MDMCISKDMQMIKLPNDSSLLKSSGLFCNILLYINCEVA